MVFDLLIALFDLTIGITRSFKKAERILGSQTVDDFVYYNTFIKGTPLTYTTEAGLVTKPVKLRDCEIVIMIDNLHRLLSPGVTPRRVGIQDMIVRYTQLAEIILYLIQCIYFLYFSFSIN